MYFVFVDFGTNFGTEGCFFSPRVFVKFKFCEMNKSYTILQNEGKLELQYYLNLQSSEIIEQILFLFSLIHSPLFSMHLLTISAAFLFMHYCILV